MGNNCCGLNESDDDIPYEATQAHRERPTARVRNKRNKKQNTTNSRNYRYNEPVYANWEEHCRELVYANLEEHCPLYQPSVSNVPVVHAGYRNVQSVRKVNVSVPKVNVVPPSRVLQPRKTKPPTERNYSHGQYEQKLHQLQRYENQRKWRDEDVVSQIAKVPKYTAKNVINLLEEGSTVPFISRYRRDKVDNCPPESVRKMQSAYTNIKKVHERVQNIFEILAKENVEVDDHYLVALVNAKTLEEVEFLYAPFNPENQMSLAEAYSSLGLEFIAIDILEGKEAYSEQYLTRIARSQTGVRISVSEVAAGLQHSVAEIVSKNQRLLDYINNHSEKRCIQICASSKGKSSQHGKDGSDKFENYHNFCEQIKNIKPHQILAINRGENQNALTITVKVPANMKDGILNKCWWLFCMGKSRNPLTANFLVMCFNDAYVRLIEPQLIKQVRTELTKTAVEESVKVFSMNLRRLLLTPPIRGEKIIALDPGFTHGCKVAAVACNGFVLQTDVIFPHHTRGGRRMEAEKKLKDIVHSFGAYLIALGNGTGSRETEQWLTDLIRRRLFHPYDVKYCIVDECGASVYSVSAEAERDLPGMDPNFRSAVSLARRLQDPLSEYVKIEPKHLGVGMYQHDLPEEALKEAVNSIIVECVSFVGVDLNTGSEPLLRKVAGLTAVLAKQIILWREKNGCFVNRRQLLEVKNLGHKQFEQCAGFVKILPSTCFKAKCHSTQYSLNPLDATSIHPESYDVVVRFLTELNCNLDAVGTEALKHRITQYVQQRRMAIIAKKFQMPLEKMKFVIDTLMLPAEYDIREEFDKPLFKTGIISIEQLTTMNEVLTGRVVNVTHFGAFVDIGVGKDGLIHTSKMNNKRLALGDTVSVVVLSVDGNKKIALKLVG